ncbi:MAG TPA: tRNA pseudouridine(55) synthase TruB [Mycobacteriales bacterium]|nr:tRNA pseudouridine(55) synthase TruB [Mycobacteriales bacterium]
MTGTPPGGLLVVDKPAGWTSHDVVGRVRRLAGTRRVGHAGTLDPMATGVLLVGIERATRLLGHLALTEKRYLGTVVLGLTTSTDDAEGEPGAERDTSAVADGAVFAAARELTGPLEQVPPAVSAIKVAGVRSYTRARAGEDVSLPPRRVTVHALDVLAVRRHGARVEVDVDVTCSSGTYIRAIARDLGARLGVGGHLSALRRTRVGSWDLAAAHTLDDLAADGAVAAALVPLDDVAATSFPRRDVDADEAGRVAHGVRLPAIGLGPGPVAVFDPGGRFLALVEERDGAAVPIAVFVG